MRKHCRADGIFGPKSARVTAMITATEALIFWAITVICAGVGAYMGAYLKKKGENLATHEDLNKLVEQMKVTTETTKGIEARITGDLWNAQKRWELTKETLIEIVRLVGRAEITIKNAVVDFEYKSRGRNPPSLLPHKSESILDECIEIAFSLDNHRLMMMLVCGMDVIPAYIKLADAYLATVLCLDVKTYDYEKAKERLKEFGSALARFQIAV